VEFHPLAELSPPMEKDTFEALVESIRQRGLKVPIVLLEGKILDGRHRYKACIEVEVEPQFISFEAEDAHDTVADLQLLRHHWNESQRAMMGARLANAHGHFSKETLSRGGVTGAEAAETMNTSLRSLDRAREVLKHGVPALVEAVDSGEIAVRPAAEIARKSPEEQVKALQDPKSIRADTSGNDEWYTPTEYIDMAREVMGDIDLDPASCEFAQERIKAATFFTAEDDGLEQRWAGRVWLNPPYSKGLIDKFVEKVRDEYRFGEVEQVIVLTHNFTDTAWFHTLAADATAICFTKGRIKFYNEDGVGNSPTSGHAFFYFGPNIDIFTKTFSEIGLVLTPH
jgi:ParB family chromosome partitioning protein